MQMAAQRLRDLACIAVSRMQNLHGLTAITPQSSQRFALMLEE